MRRLLALISGLWLAVLGHASSSSLSNLSYSGPLSTDASGFIPTLQLTEGYILAQTNNSFPRSTGSTGCSVNKPCVDGACCNSNGLCGYRPEHCHPTSPASCVSNCGASAPCGLFSTNGKTSCPLGLCCSYFGFCGPTNAFCRDQIQAEGGNGAPCQGECNIAATPSCGENSSTASRRVSYYESWNSRRRLCDKVLPHQLNTTGLTHLVLAFAMIDPETYYINQMSPEDDYMYTQFMALPGSFKKVIGVGGWEYSDPGATHYTWSEMTSNSGNRKAFIKSLQQFVSKWKFSGIEIHWEWPGSSARGGNPNDTKNLVALVAELRGAMGSDFSISVNIPAQYEYLKNMDLGGLEAIADWLTILTYDLHGAWDAFVPGIGPRIRPHTDLAEIEKALDLLWSAKVTPSKVNLGIANYGRGYTVSSKDCMWYDCVFTGPSTAGTCTKQDGVLSACEIQRIIIQHGLKPKLIDGGAGVKEIAWNDQWVGYDDAETLDLKLKLANNRCLGGTSLWALDYAACDASGGTPQPGNSAAPIPSVLVPTVSVPGSLTAGPGSTQKTWDGPVLSNSPPNIDVSSGGVSATVLPPWIQSSVGVTSSGSIVVGPGNSASTSKDYSLSTPSPTGGISSSDASNIVLSSWVQSTIQATPSTSAAGSQASSDSSLWAQPTSQKSSTSASQVIWPTTNYFSTMISTSPIESKPSWNSVDVTSSSETLSTINWTNVQSPTTANAANSTLLSAHPSEVSSDSTLVGAPQSSFSTTFALTSGTGTPDSQASPTGSTGLSLPSQSSIKSLSWQSNVTTWLPSNVMTSAGAASTSVQATWITNETTQMTSQLSFSTEKGISTAINSTGHESGHASPTTAFSWGESTSAAISSVQVPSSSQETPGITSGTSGAATSAQGTSVGASSTTSVATSPGQTPSGSATNASGQETSTPGQSKSDTTTNAQVTSGTVTTTAQATSGVATTTSQGTGGVATNTAVVPVIVWDSDSHSDSDPNCQPNDCVAECMGWRLLTFAVIKRPICPCVPRTCSKDDKGKKKKHGKCKLLGCGCGWMGIAFGPGCPGPEIDISGILPPGGLFGQNPCRFFGCPGDKAPGIIGRDGFCFGPGCDPCPAEICSGHGPLPGPNPTQPPDKPKECEEKDKTRVTERFIYCTENLNFTVSALPSSILGTTSTLVSSVCVPMVQATIKACPGAMDGYTTTQTTTLAKTQTTVDSPACTIAPLSLDDDEGSNDDPFPSSIHYSSNTTSLASSTAFFSSSAQSSALSSEFASSSVQSSTWSTDFASSSVQSSAWSTEFASSSVQSSASSTVFASSSVQPSSSSTESTSSAQSSSSSTMSSSSDKSSASPSPGYLNRHGNWRAKITVSMEKKRSQLDWELFDPNGFSAGSDSLYADSDSWSVYIESKNRIEEHSALYGVTMMLQGGLNVDTARVKFIIQKPMENCAYADGNPCRPWMITENRPEDQMFEVNSCEFNCQNRADAKLVQPDLWCNDLNDAMWMPYNSGFRREFYCGWKGF